MVPGVVAGAALVGLFLAPDRVMTRAAAGGLFGYPNARAALYLEAMIAALIFALVVDRWRWRAVGVVGAAILATAPFIDRGMAASLLVPVAAVAAIPWSARLRRVGVVVAAALLLAILGTTVALGALYEKGPRTSRLDRAVDATLTERRVTLWNDALAIVASHPVTGVGPGRFQITSPTARSDKDARWAHNEFLQQAAETGLPGGLLMLASFAWGFALLFRRAPSNKLALLGAMALAGLGITASVDYVMHFPAILLVAAALLGTAATPDRNIVGAGPASSASQIVPQSPRDDAARIQR